ncbi:DUF1036 domain-containing protein [Leptolyngbya sp. NIES-2104]|uniref:DUF1036 domain-containing protein n=1 Tax=Leptolyngbya sp. NIES-2104 TaxID=1552121 RepID=UPI0006ECBC7C|nr:DUF1036 domain-containing protein [Leptolyngbya sp. NIES-2104]GAP96964.1 hypothetical protein NIES2104_35110 [Leptolyngbya sp. NIES-2104]
MNRLASQSFAVFLVLSGSVGAVLLEHTPAVAGCNVFGCSESTVAECNPFGCPNSPRGQACTAFGCPPSPQAAPPPNSGSWTSSSSLRQVCNGTGERVNVALGYESGISRGWWTLSNGGCVTLESHPVHGAVTHYYANSVRKENRSRWYGDRSRQYCVANSQFEMGSNGGCLNGAEFRPFGLINDGVTLTP